MKRAKRGSRDALRLRRLGMGLMTVVSLHVGCSCIAAGNIDAATTIRQSLAVVRQAKPRLDWDSMSVAPPATVIAPYVAAYFEFYGLDLPCAHHRFGYVAVGSKSIATHLFVPEGTRSGTVVVAHGYYDHAATWRHAIRAFLAAQLAVVIYDQPGHGLSSGARATIGDFSEYVQVLREILERTREHLPGPCHVAAHSMGCAVAIDYLLHDSNAVAIENVVLVAPLVRSAHWHLSNGGNLLAKPFVKSLPRVFRRNSADEGYLEFVTHDPLHSHRVPLAWVDALKRWNVRIMKCKPSDRAVLIIQGDHDDTVDITHNLAVLKQLFPRQKLVTLPGGRHQLLNEAKPLRQKTLTAMCSFLTEGQP